jgi:translin
LADRSQELAAAGDLARDALEATHRARETTLVACRAATRACALAIRAVHRHEITSARDHLANAEKLLTEAANATADRGEVRYAGFLHDAQKEYVEANLTLAWVTQEPAPDADTLGVETPAYLNGVAEAASELRRQVLDCLRRGDLAEAEALFAVMDEAYGLLVTVDYPEAITHGLRRSTDALRAVLERTRGDLTTAQVLARFGAAKGGEQPERE